MPNVESKQLSRQTILVMDDVEMNRSIVTKVFKDVYHVLTAENGAVGMEILHQHEVDLVLLDIVMPVMDGFAVLQAMKSEKRLEDHPLNTKIAMKLLTTKGLLVEHAENGQIAVDMFSHSEINYFDAVLMDIRMPVMDGIDATKAIRNLPRRDAQTVPIIAMTANAFEDDIQQTRGAGMNAHLSKPIQTEVMYETLTKLLKVDRDLCR